MHFVSDGCILSDCVVVEANTSFGSVVIVSNRKSSNANTHFLALQQVDELRKVCELFQFLKNKTKINTALSTHLENHWLIRIIRLHGSSKGTFR